MPVAVGLVDAEAAVGDRVVHVDEQDALHAVEAEALPHLHAEDVRQRPRLPEEPGVVAAGAGGGGSIRSARRRSRCRGPRASPGAGRGCGSRRPVRRPDRHLLRNLVRPAVSPTRCAAHGVRVAGTGCRVNRPRPASSLRQGGVPLLRGMPPRDEQRHHEGHDRGDPAEHERQLEGGGRRHRHPRRRRPRRMPARRR